MSEIKLDMSQSVDRNTPLRLQEINADSFCEKLPQGLFLLALNSNLTELPHRREHDRTLTMYFEE